MGCVGVAFVGDVATTCAGVAGVETCEKSLSDGACDVAGVSGSDGAAIVEASEATSSGVCSCASSSINALDGIKTVPLS